MDSPESRLMATLGGFASEMERVRCGVRDALSRKAREGYSTRLAPRLAMPFFIAVRLGKARRHLIARFIAP